MKDIIISLFGSYAPIMTEVAVFDDTGTVVYNSVVAQGMAGVDWVWIASVFLFGIVLYSLFRIVGMLFKG